MGVDTGKQSPSQLDLDLSAAHASEEGGSRTNEPKRDAVFGEINGDGPDYRSVSAVVIVCKSRSYNRLVGSCRW
jgi:hypothetical protein